MEQLKNKLCSLFGKSGIDKLKYDPDARWSTLHREWEKNNLYKWTTSEGLLLKVFEKDGEEGVLDFAREKLVSMMYNEGRSTQFIKTSDYLKWKQTINAIMGDFDHGTSLAHKFQQHDAQWKLGKRGVEGETLIHLLLNEDNPVCSEIARILLRQYPGLANDIYMDDDKFGQTALHLAIMHDDFETIRLLLELGVDVNARAHGKFFAPDDQKYTVTKNTNYFGQAYLGEYPIAFAACLGNKDIYDLLIEHGADPDMQDCYGNTVLHMCVITFSNTMYGYALRHWVKPADPHIVNTAGCTPLTLATKLGRKEIFNQMLELSKVEFWRFSDMACSAYPLTTLDTIRPDGTTNYDSALMTVIDGNKPEHLDMIGHEVIQRLLADKWNAFAIGKLTERLILLVLHLISITAIAFLKPRMLNEMTSLQQSKIRFVTLLFFSFISMGICFHFVFIQQGGELRTQGLYRYIRNLSTAPSKIIFILANLCMMPMIPCIIQGWFLTLDVLFLISLPGSWMYLLFFARSYKLTGPFVQMIYSMLAGDMIRFAIISTVFLVSFSPAFYFFGKDMPKKTNLDPNDPNYCSVRVYGIGTYSNFLETFVTLFRASMGGYDYEEFACANYQLLAKMLFVLYMIIMPIMMINILIAMMGNTYTTVVDQAEKAWRQQFAQIIMVLERSIKQSKLATCQLNYSIKLKNNGNSDLTMETRGLIVIKQIEKTRAKQRKQAVTNWQVLGCKVIKAIGLLGIDQVRCWLHSHEYAASHVLDEFCSSSRRRLSQSLTSQLHENFPTLNVSSSSTDRSASVVELMKETMVLDSWPVTNHSAQQQMPNIPVRHNSSSNILSPNVRVDTFVAKDSPDRVIEQKKEDLPTLSRF